MLELFGCFSLTPASFRYLAEHCTFLLTLNMGQCYKVGVGGGEASVTRWVGEVSVTRWVGEVVRSVFQGGWLKWLGQCYEVGG